MIALNGQASFKPMVTVVNCLNSQSLNFTVAKYCLSSSLARYALSDFGNCAVVNGIINQEFHFASDTIKVVELLITKVVVFSKYPN